MTPAVRHARRRLEAARSRALEAAQALTRSLASDGVFGKLPAPVRAALMDMHGALTEEALASAGLERALKNSESSRPCGLCGEETEKGNVCGDCAANMKGTRR